jgi:hypothetical protein
MDHVILFWAVKDSVYSNERHQTTNRGESVYLFREYLSNECSQQAIENIRFRAPLLKYDSNKHHVLIAKTCPEGVFVCSRCYIFIGFIAIANSCSYSQGSYFFTIVTFLSLVRVVGGYLTFVELCLIEGDAVEANNDASIIPS